ncbi:hypothetical protein LUZ60_006327 [Juncus effusus]|nr:hypothetical protein LUZ60_006327 [Juncus effusus]
MVGHGAHAIPLEVVSTVMELADVACFALEHRPHRHKPISAVKAGEEEKGKEEEEGGEEIERVRAENLRLRRQLAKNFVLIQELCNRPDFSDDCPPDLYTRLEATVNTPSFLQNLESAQEETKETLEKITEAVEVPIVVGNSDPSWWIWVPNINNNSEEPSGIDKSSYVIINQEEVIDGLANFVARCILEDPKSTELTPEDIQKAVTNALEEIKGRLKWKNVWEAGKIIYTLSSWGIALYGLYTNRALVKAAARGIGATASVVMKAL